MKPHGSRQKILTHIKVAMEFLPLLTTGFMVIKDNPEKLNKSLKSCLDFHENKRYKIQ